MSNFNEFYSALIPSCIALNESRFDQKNELYIKAIAALSTIFSSLSNIQDIVEAELLYLENESTFSLPEDTKRFANAIESYHYAINTLKIIMDEPEMYIKYGVPVCSSVKTNDKNGIPKDAFCNALTSHKTRLQNSKQISTSVKDREVVNLRFANVVSALKLYKDLQKQVLGL